MSTVCGAGEPIPSGTPPCVPLSFVPLIKVFQLHDGAALQYPKIKQKGGPFTTAIRSLSCTCIKHDRKISSWTVYTPYAAYTHRWSNTSHPFHSPPLIQSLQQLKSHSSGVDTAAQRDASFTASCPNLHCNGFWI